MRDLEKRRKNRYFDLWRLDDEGRLVEGGMGWHRKRRKTKTWKREQYWEKGSSPEKKKNGKQQGQVNRNEQKR